MRKAKPGRSDFQPSQNGLREAILGLLAIKPMTGYDLSRSYQRALQHIWYAPLGQIYPTLRKMQREGLLRVTIKVQKHRPNRKVYSLTAKGRGALKNWLSQPPELPRMHHEFIHKMFLLNHMDAASRATHVDVYIERCEAWAANLKEAERRLEPSLKGPHAESARSQWLALRHIIRVVEREAESAREIAADIKASTGKPKKPTGSARQPAPERAAFAGFSLSPQATAGSRQ